VRSFGLALRAAVCLSIASSTCLIMVFYAFAPHLRKYRQIAGLQPCYELADFGVVIVEQLSNDFCVELEARVLGEAQLPFGSTP
jgi:hypothetical protein